MTIRSLSKVQANGKVTIPIEIRRILGISEGDKILFSRNSEGEIVVNNASASALSKVQRAMQGLDSKIGVKNEEDVQALIDEIRYPDAK